MSKCVLYYTVCWLGLFCLCAHLCEFKSVYTVYFVSTCKGIIYSCLEILLLGVAIPGPAQATKDSSDRENRTIRWTPPQQLSQQLQQQLAEVEHDAVDRLSILDRTGQDRLDRSSTVCIAVEQIHCKFYSSTSCTLKFTLHNV